MNNDLILERLANLHHHALLKEAETNRQRVPAVAMTSARWVRPWLRALSIAMSLVWRAVIGG